VVNDLPGNPLTTIPGASEAGTPASGASLSGLGATPPAYRAPTTVSLVTFNAMHWIEACVESVFSQTCPPLEVVIVDNASSDGTREWLRDLATRRGTVRLIESEENLGYARGHNTAIRMARGDYVCLLNQDVVLDADFLDVAASVLDGDETVAAVQAKVRRIATDGTRTSCLDTTGLRILRDRRVVSRGQEEVDAGQYDKPGSVFGADGPCPVYRRAALEDVRVPLPERRWEYLDEDFFMYKEDVDLAWRLGLYGWTAAYEPRALAWHGRGAGGPASRSSWSLIRGYGSIPGWVRRMSWRNQRLMQLKNERRSEYLRDFLPIAWWEFRSTLFMIAFAPSHLRAVPQLVALLPRTRRKRASIMAGRRGRMNLAAAWLRDRR
jgi:GT2 family glycosyltransferase